ncbi:unnamed protein product, partial [Coregonus sp. 'balchen']
MIRVLIHLAALPIWVTGQSLSSKVHQTPIAILKGSKNNVQLTCNHTIQSYNMILWYQQSTGDTAMKLIGYALATSITMEKSFEKHFSVSGDGQTEASLHLLSLRAPEDSAVYYCAASQHSDVDTLLSSTKTLAKPEYVGDFSEDKYVATKTVFQRGYFTVKKLEAGDSCIYLCAVGQSLSSKVHQTPIAILKGSKDNVKLTCNHTIQSYNTILWYQQSTGDTAMKLIGYAYATSITIEKSFEKHFNVSGDGWKEASLHLLSLRAPEDSAVYYCAASQHSDGEHLLSSTKTLSDRKLGAVLRKPASEV